MPNSKDLNKDTNSKSDKKNDPVEAVELEDRYTASERAADFKKYAQLKKKK